jgi:peptide/nickel transport system substrate-binding protein
MRSTFVAIAAAILATACSSKDGPQSGATGANGGTMIYDAPVDAVDVFPPYVGDLVGRFVQDLVFERLAEIGPELQTVGDKGFAPLLAKTWTWAPDSLSIAFSLDPRARFHDGKPVTANDVRFSFKILTDPKVGSPIAPLLTNLDSVSVRDSLTPVVWFKKRTPEQFYDVAYQLVIVPEHVYGSIPADQLHTSEITRRPVGTGRFRFAKWLPIPPTITAARSSIESSLRRRPLRPRRRNCSVERRTSWTSSRSIKFPGSTAAPSRGQCPSRSSLTRSWA